MELLKNYDCTIEYHPREANRVANVLSRKSKNEALMLQLKDVPSPEMWELRKINMEFQINGTGAMMAIIKVRPNLLMQIKEA